MSTSSANEGMPAWLKGDLPPEPSANPPEAEAGEQPAAVPTDIKAEAPAEMLPDAPEAEAEERSASVAERDEEAVSADDALRQEAPAASHPSSGAAAGEPGQPDATAGSPLEPGEALAEAQALEAFVDAGEAAEQESGAAEMAEGAHKDESESGSGANVMANEPAVTLEAVAPEGVSNAPEPDATSDGPSDERMAEAGQPAVAASEGAPALAAGKRRTRKGKVVAEPQPAPSVEAATERAGEPGASADFRPVSLAEPAAALGLEALIESLLFVADGAVPVARLAEALEVSPREIEATLAALSQSYQQRGLSLQRFRDRVQLTTAPAAAERVERFLGLAAATPLSRAALETLAIVAYQQPVTRPQIDAVRGVNSDSVIKNLLSKGLVEESGRAEGPGRPVLYSTTSEFMQHFGLASLSDLPPLSLPEPSSQPPAPEAILKG